MDIAELLREILEELQAVRKLLEDQDCGNIGQFRAGGTEYHLNGFSTEEIAKILNEFKRPML